MGLDIVEMVMAVEEEFEIEISNADAEKAVTVGALFECVRKRVAPASVEKEFRGPVWDRYVAVICHELGVKRERLVPTARFVPDLHAD